MYVLLKRGIPYSLKAINQENPTFQTQLFQDFKFFSAALLSSCRLGGKGLRKMTSWCWDPAAMISASACPEQRCVGFTYNRDGGKDKGAA